MTVQIDDDGRIFIPKEVREKLGVDAGSCLELHIESGADDDRAMQLRPARRTERSNEDSPQSEGVTAEDIEVIEWIPAVGKNEVQEARN